MQYSSNRELIGQGIANIVVPLAALGGILMVTSVRMMKAISLLHPELPECSLLPSQPDLVERLKS